MKEIKFVTHISRNFYLFFLIYLTLKLLFGYSPDIQTFLLGLISYVLGYTPVYFLNDSQDHEEDRLYKRHNLFTTINNPILFWFITGVLILAGLYAGFAISKIGYLLILLCYVFNIFHSVKPFVFRKKVFVATINYVALSITKFYLIVLYLQYIPSVALLSIMFLFVMIATFAGLLYKREKQRNRKLELIFGTLLLLSVLISGIQYPTLLLFSLPISIILFFIAFRHSTTQIPVSFFQTIFFVYTIFIYFLFS